MPLTTFWKRYFFRVHQIEREEKKRKALLERMRVCFDVLPHAKVRIPQVPRKVMRISVGKTTKKRRIRQSQ